MKHKYDVALFTLRIVLMVIGAGTVFGELAAMNWIGRAVALGSGGVCWMALYEYFKGCVVND